MSIVEQRLAEGIGLMLIHERNSKFSSFVQSTVEVFTIGTLFVWLSILWSICSILIITIPPSSTAAIQTWKSIQKNRSFRTLFVMFLSTFKKQFLKSYAAGLPLLLSMFVTYVNVTTLSSVQGHFSIRVFYVGVMIAVDIFILMLGVHTLTYIGRNYTVRDACIGSWIIVRRRPFKSLTMAFGIIMICVLFLYIPLIGFLSFGASLGWLANKFTKEDIA